MKHILLATAAFFALAGAAQAADAYASMYGNTVTITGADGAKTTTFVNQDMTWEQHAADGKVVKGTYAWKDAATACFTQTDPAPASPDKATTCLPNQTAHNVGDSWSVPGMDGKPVTVAITAGR
jgi:opacity protein-like surface antigen